MHHLVRRRVQARPCTKKPKVAGAKLAEQKLEKPPHQQKTGLNHQKKGRQYYVALLDGIRFPENMRVRMSQTAINKHSHMAAYFVKKRIGVTPIGMESPSGKARQVGELP